MKKTALVTGGSRGIGAATALALAKRGWTVHVNYRKSEAAAHEIAAQTGGLAVRADVADLQQVERMFAQTGPVSLLVNNAGIAHAGLLTDITPDAWQRLFDVNVTGMYHCCRCAIPHMVHEKSGQIVNLASILGTNGGSCEVAYSATKGAVIALTKALAKELGPSGIRVNCVSPGVILTDMVANVAPEVLAELAQEAPLGKNGTPEDVARAMVYLAGAEFVTGQNLPVNGGFVL